MPEFGKFTNFITKGYETEERDGRRIVKGHITVEVVDRQNEFVAVDEVLSVIKNYFDVYPAIHDWHSNRPVGKALTYKKSEIEGHPSVYIEAEIYKKDGVSLYDKVWEKIVKGEYTGFSMGGASKIREPIVKDGKLVMNLKNLELYEISVCPLPANQLAIFDYVNDFAKATGLGVKYSEDGRPRIQCTGVECEFHKMDKHEYKCDGETDMCDRCGGAKEDKVHQVEKVKKTDETVTMVTPATVSPEDTDFRTDKDKEKKIIEKAEELIDILKQYKQFQKPIRGHDWSYWQNKLKEENPEYTDEQVNEIIGSWEKEEREKASMTKQEKVDRAYETSGETVDKEELEKDHAAGDNMEQASAPHVKERKRIEADGDVTKAINSDVDIDVDNTGGEKKLEEIKKVARESSLILMLSS